MEPGKATGSFEAEFQGEQAAQKAMPGRTAIIRPGYIVGPDDPTGRFTYWPVRFDKGGEIAVPGAPTDPVEIIDVRDLAAFLVHLVEGGTTGVFNACGPEKRMPWGSLVEACQKAGHPTPGSRPRKRWEKAGTSWQDPARNKKPSSSPPGVKPPRPRAEKGR